MDDVALTTLICERLSQIPGWAWRPEPDDEPYTDDEVGIFYGQLGVSPDRAVGVRVYGTTDNEREHFHSRRVQLRLRGARGRTDGADVLAGLAFGALQGLSRVGGISDASRLSMAPAGADENGRQERTENYTIILDNQEALS
jgi:hypothetical protein